MRNTVIYFRPRVLPYSHLHSYNFDGAEKIFTSAAEFVNKQDRPAVVHRNIWVQPGQRVNDKCFFANDSTVEDRLMILAGVGHVLLLAAEGSMFRVR